MKNIMKKEKKKKNIFMNKAIKIVCVKPTLVLFLIQYKHVRNDISHSTVENWSEIRSTINNISIKIRVWKYKTQGDSQKGIHLQSGKV